MLTKFVYHYKEIWERQSSSRKSKPISPTGSRNLTYPSSAKSSSARGTGLQMSSGKTMQRRIVIRHHKKNMIHVEYEQENNYPHDRELILFDRNAFQPLGDEGLRKVNKKYNILCPCIFVMECLSPNRASEAQKRWILNRLRLIENPIVFLGQFIDPISPKYHLIFITSLFSPQRKSPEIV